MVVSRTGACHTPLYYGTLNVSMLFVSANGKTPVTGGSLAHNAFLLCTLRCSERNISILTIASKTFFMFPRKSEDNDNNFEDACLTSKIIYAKRMQCHVHSTVTFLVRISLWTWPLDSWLRFPANDYVRLIKITDGTNDQTWSPPWIFWLLERGFSSYMYQQPKIANKSGCSSN